MNRKIIISGAAAVLAVAGIAGCGVPGDAGVVDGVPAVANAPAPAEPAQQQQEEPASAPAPSIVPAGSSAAVGGWTVGVSGTEGDADGTISATNEFNDAPAGRYVLVTVAGEYGGSGSGDIWADLTYRFVGNDGVIYDEAYQVTPADSADWPTQARAGAVVQYQALFDVPTAAVPGGTLLVSGWTESFDSVEAEFDLGL